MFDLCACGVRYPRQPRHLHAHAVGCLGPRNPGGVCSWFFVCAFGYAHSLALKLTKGPSAGGHKHPPQCLVHYRLRLYEQTNLHCVIVDKTEHMSPMPILDVHVHTVTCMHIYHTQYTNLHMYIHTHHPTYRCTRAYAHG